MYERFFTSSVRIGIRPTILGLVPYKGSDIRFQSNVPKKKNNNLSRYVIACVGGFLVLCWSAADKAIQ